MEIKKLFFEHLLFYIVKHFGYGVFPLLDKSVSENVDDIPRPSTLFASTYFSRPITATEVGVANGLNAKSILDLLDVEKMYLIDNWKSFEYRNCKQIAERRLSGYNVVILEMDSSEAHEHIPEVDFCYIDADHTYNVVYNDLRNYWKKVKKNGILAGHDIDKYDVARAVYDFSREVGKEPCIAGRDYWFIK
jgi:predicted O-methyltransferase YrrM